MNAMKKTKMIPVRRVLRLSVWGTLPLLLLSDLLSAQPYSPLCACSELFVPCTLLLFYPLPREIPAPSVIAYLLAGAAALGLALSGAGPAWRVLTFSLLLTGYLLYRLVRLFSELVYCKIGTALIRIIESCAKLAYAAMLLQAGMLLLFSAGWRGGAWLVLPALAVLFPLLYLRAYSGRTLFVSDTYMRLFKEMSRRTPACARPLSAREENKLASVYNQAVAVMEAERLYLQDGCTVEALARRLGTTESYLSKAVNDYFGNFKRFVNNFRVDYAVTQMKQNPNIRICDLFPLCGFKTLVSFDMAFKYVMHKTPSEYCRDLSAGRLE